MSSWSRCRRSRRGANQEAIRALFRVVNRYVGNPPPIPGVFPDYPAPIVRNGVDGRELAMARSGRRRSQPASLKLWALDWARRSDEEAQCATHAGGLALLVTIY